MIDPHVPVQLVAVRKALAAMRTHMRTLRRRFMLPVDVTLQVNLDTELLATRLTAEARFALVALHVRVEQRAAVAVVRALSAHPALTLAMHRPLVRQLLAATREYTRTKLAVNRFFRVVFVLWVIRSYCYRCRVITHNGRLTSWCVGGVIRA